MPLALALVILDGVVAGVANPPQSILEPGHLCFSLGWIDFRPGIGCIRSQQNARFVQVELVTDPLAQRQHLAPHPLDIDPGEAALALGLDQLLAHRFQLTLDLDQREDMLRRLARDRLLPGLRRLVR